MRTHLLLLFFALFSLPQTSPAPIVWHPDTGWQTEGKVPILDSPQAQIQQAKGYEAKKDWENALNSYRVTSRLWPNSPYVPQALFGTARAQEELGDFYKAFLTYEKLIEKYPNDERFNEVLRRQYEIGNRFLKGERLKIWRIKTFPSMDKTCEIYETIIKNGPYSEVAPMCRMKIGEARDKQKLHEEAVLSYQKVIDDYPDSPLAPEAYFHIGKSYYLQSDRAEYDQSAANRAALAFTDFLSRYPKHENAKEAEDTLKKIQAEQARGLWQLAQYYDRKQHNPAAALVYYNDLIAKFPNSTYASQAKPRLEEIKKQATLPRPPDATKPESGQAASKPEK